MTRYIAWRITVGRETVYDCFYVCDYIERISRSCHFAMEIASFLCWWKELRYPHICDSIGSSLQYMNLFNAYILCIAAHADIYQDHVFPAQNVQFSIWAWMKLLGEQINVLWCFVVYYSMCCLFRASTWISVFMVFCPDEMSLLSCWPLCPWMSDICPWNAWRHSYFCTR